MTNEGWLKGLEELMAAFPDRDLPEEVLEKRGEIYRRELAGLTDEQWRFAVSEAIKSERWFPTVHSLLEFAESAGAPQRPVVGLLGKGDGWGDREEFRRGFEEVFKPALRAHGIDVEAVAKVMPEEKAEAR